MGGTRQRRTAVLVVLLAFAWLGGCVQMTSGAVGKSETFPGPIGGKLAAPAATGSPAGTDGTAGNVSQGGRDGIGAGIGLGALPGSVDTEVTLPDGRRYVLHLPPNLDGRPKPVVIALHGLFLTAGKLAWDTGLSGYADKHDFVLAYGIGRANTWNVGDGCCSYAGAHHVNDVQYLINVLDDVGTKIQIDRSRVYLLGFSSGDSLAMYAQCTRPDVFAASAGSSGALMTPCRSPRQQIRILHLHGRQDRTVPLYGGPSEVMRYDVPNSALLSTQVRRTAPNSVVVTKALPCAHLWPRKDNSCRYDATDASWRWLSKFSRPIAPVTP